MMTDPVFVVLRAKLDAVQTIGPSGEVFSTFKEASVIAKEMSNRYPQQTFYVCQTISVYDVQHKVRVKRVGTAELTKKSTKPMTKKTDGLVAPSVPNVYPIRLRGRARY